MHRVRSYQAPDKISMFLVTKSMLFCLCPESMCIFETKSGELTKTINFNKKICGMMHHVTYLNKLVLWSGNNAFLHNVIEDERIYDFKSFESDIETIVQSPVVDVVAISLNNGQVLLWNLKYDELLFKFKQ